MLNSFSSSSAHSSSNTSISNVGNTINISPIIRTNNDTKFKKIKIDSQEFDLMLDEIPRILSKEIIPPQQLENCGSSYQKFKYFIQEIQILSFNPIQLDTMLIEYRPIGEKQCQEIEYWVSKYGEWSKSKLIAKIYEELLDK